jgi:hypothetical protein
MSPKAAPKVSTTAKAPAVAGQKDLDVLLEGTYATGGDELDAQDTHDEIDDFEARLAGQRAQPRAAPQRKAQQLPLKPTSGNIIVKPTDEHKRLMKQPPATEEEEERQQDISDVRNLGRSSSDDDD